MADTQVGIFTYTQPHEVGLSAQIIGEAIASLAAQGIQMHSVLIARGDALVCEAYWQPYGRDDLHRMYSITKSFVSLGIGVLADQGKLSLDDRIVTFFPEELPRGKPVPEQLEAVTIRNMLMMASCHRGTAYKVGGRSNYIGSFSSNWVGSFFTVEPSHDPGTIFQYDTSATHVLGALIEKISGKKLIEFFTEHLFGDLKVSPDTYILTDPKGVSTGGSGLMMRPIDLLAVTRMLADGGRGSISSSYIEAATSKQIATHLSSSSHSSESRNGYGYKFWRTSRDGWAMLGMGGQMAICVPEKDLLFVTTADTQGSAGDESAIMREIWKIVDSVQEGPIEEDLAENAFLETVLQDLALPVIANKENSSMEQTVEKKLYRFDKNDLGLNSVSFLFSEESSITLSMDRGTYTFAFGMGENIFIELPQKMALAQKAAASGGWLDSTTLAITLQFLGAELGSLLLQASFKEDRLTLLLRLFGELSFEGFDGLLSSLPAE